MTESTITVGHDGLASDRIWRESGGQLQAFVRRRIADPHEADDVVGAIIERDEAGPSDALRELAVCMEPLLEGLPPRGAPCR